MRHEFIRDNQKYVKQDIGKQTCDQDAEGSQEDFQQIIEKNIGNIYAGKHNCREQCYQNDIFYGQ
ncbi:MAG: hypothetical protein J5915_06830, partial [Acidaminococcaceae bacterium]|nr:hypothetical protein [Acidaminococcaceae bacterium]